MVTTPHKNWALHVAGAISLICYSALLALSLQPGKLPLTQFYPFLYLPWIVLLALFFIPRGKITLSLKPIIFWAVLFRVVGLFAEPIYEDDYYRFLWDGYQTASSANPYDSTPMSHFGDPDTSEEFSDILDGINYPNLPTVYAPSLQYIFLLSYTIAAGKLLMLKLLFLLAEGVMLFALSKLLDVRRFLFAAWCPLLVFESSFQAHPDVIGACFLTLGILTLYKKANWSPMAYLGIAVATKVFAVVVAPFWLRKDKWFRQCILLSGVVVLIYAPFWVQGSDAGWYSLRTMAKEWEFNSALLFMATHLNISWGLARTFGLGLFALIYGTLLISFWKKRAGDTTVFPPLDIVFGCFFVLSPVINPWYLIWMFPFVVIRPSCWSITAMIMVSLSYITGLNLADSEGLRNYQIPDSILLLEFGAITIALVVDTLSYWKRQKVN